MSASLAVRELGDPARESIVLLHAAVTTSWMWNAQAEQLAQRFHVLVPDLPGHGASAGIPWCSLEDAADRIAAVVAARTAAGRAHLVGLSLGGYVTLAAADSHPSVIASGIVSGVTVVPFPHERAMRMLGALTDPFARTDVMIALTARTLRVPPAHRAGYRVAAKQVSRGTTKRVSADAMAYRLPVGPIEVRMLAVAGEREHPLVVDSLAAISDRSPGGAVARAPGGGHGWNAECPELFTSMIRAWVEDGSVAPGLVRGFGSPTRP